MPKCVICKQDKHKGEEKKIYTARKIKVEEAPRGSKVIITYGEVQEHRFFLCNNCHILWDKIVFRGGLGLTILTCIFLTVVSFSQSIDWMFPVALFGFVAGSFVVALLSADERLKKKARQERSKDGIEVFNERRFNELLKENEHLQ